MTMYRMKATPHHEVYFIFCGVRPDQMDTSAVGHDETIEWKLLSALQALLWASHRPPVISPKKASDGELWHFLWSAPKQTLEKTISLELIHYLNHWRTGASQYLNVLNNDLSLNQRINSILVICNIHVFINAQSSLDTMRTPMRMEFFLTISYYLCGIDGPLYYFNDNMCILQKWQRKITGPTLNAHQG